MLYHNYTFKKVKEPLNIGEITLHRLEIKKDKTSTFLLSLPKSMPHFYQKLDFEYNHLNTKTIGKLKVKTFFKLLKEMKKISTFNFKKFENELLHNRENVLLIVEFENNRLNISFKNFGINRIEYHSNDLLIPTINEVLSDNVIKNLS